MILTFLLNVKQCVAKVIHHAIIILVGGDDDVSDLGKRYKF